MPQTQAQLDRIGLPSETLKLRTIRGKGIEGGAEEAVLRIFMPWLIIKMYHLPWSGLIDKFSPERPPRSWLISPPITEALPLNVITLKVLEIEFQPCQGRGENRGPVSS
jgi:hypothetical protein